MKRLLLLLTLALVPLMAFAQLASAQAVIIGPTSTIKVTTNAPDVATAQALAFSLALDGATPRPMTPMTCVAAVPATNPVTQVCTSGPGVALALLPVGTHTVVVSGTEANWNVTASPPISYTSAIGQILITNASIQ